METAIQKAIEGGWIPQELLMWDTQKKATEIKTYFRKDTDRFGIDYILYGHVCKAEVRPSAIDKNVALLDSLFWKALGKAEGWEGKVKMYWLDEGGYDDGSIIDGFYNAKYELEKWQFYQHRFIDALAEGKPIDEFFTNLLNKDI